MTGRDREGRKGMFLFVRLKTNQFFKFTTMSNLQAPHAKYRNFESKIRKRSSPALPLVTGGGWVSAFVPFML